MAKADILPGSLLGSSAPVQVTLQLGPPLLLEGVSNSHFQEGPPQDRLEEPDESWDQSCWPPPSYVTSDKSFPFPEFFILLGIRAKMRAPTGPGTSLSHPPGFCDLHLTTPWQVKNQEHFISWGSVAPVWSRTCLVHDLPVTGSRQGIGVESNCSETLEQCGKAVQGVWS